MLKWSIRQGAAESDQEFFAAFCEENQRAIWLAARQVLGAAREVLAYDAAQVTLCKLARQVGKLRQMNEQQRAAYVYQAARRNALNLCQAEARHEHGELNEQVGQIGRFDQVGGVTERNGDPESRLLAKEQRQELAKALEELPEMYREVLLLSVIECVSSREAAAELGISESALRQRKRRGLQMLRERLREYENKGGGE